MIQRKRKQPTSPDRDWRRRRLLRRALNTDANITPLILAARLGRVNWQSGQTSIAAFGYCVQASRDLGSIGRTREPIYGHVTHRLVPDFLVNVVGGRVC